MNESEYEEQDGSSILQCRKLNKAYPQVGEDLHVLKDINFALRKGERIAIVGASGSGKTTLLNMLGGLDLPSSGQVLVNNTDITSLSENARGAMRNEFLGFVYQFHHLLGEFTALENVSMPLLMRKTSLKMVRIAAEELLDAVGLKERMAHKPAELSGGERQRVAIARALVTKPACVLMDEPTGNLDENTGQRIQALMRNLNEVSQSSFVTVTHDHNLAKTMDRVLTLVDGQLTE
ncbi:MAG: ATP-binding cassette domain-containing protein [Pseudomonadota bacterium]